MSGELFFTAYLMNSLQRVLVYLLNSSQRAQQELVYLMSSSQQELSSSRQELVYLDEYFTARINESDEFFTAIIEFFTAIIEFFTARIEFFVARH